jgi:hypothetical protein
MGKLLRVVALLCFLGILVMGMITLPSLWGCSAAKTSLTLNAVLERTEQVDRIEEAAFRRRKIKLQVAEEVIAGRLSVAEALEAFRRLEGQQLPIVTKQLMLKQENVSEDEWLGQGVLYYVKQVLADRPDEAAAVMARLNKELQELLADRKKRPAAPDEPTIERSR